jgi:AcrR family transcriptional regulator
LVGVREQQKQATRAKVLDAARDLFDEVGYEETTVRAIADRAGVSVGSVFTTFTTKADILGQVMAERTAALTAELARVTPHLRGTACDRLSSLLAIHYDFQMRRPKLYLAYMSVSFRPAHEAGFVRMGSNPGLRAPIREILQSAIERGEVAPDLDIELAMETIISLYGFNYMRVSDGLDTHGLTQLINRQLQQLCDGLKTGGAVNPGL